MSDLAKRIEELDGPDKGVDLQLVEMIYPGDKDMRRMAERGSWSPTKSLDAAMSLVPEGWTADVRRYPDGTGNVCLHEWSPPCRNEKVIGYPTPALALCACAIRARESEGE